MHTPEKVNTQNNPENNFDALEQKIRNASPDNLQKVWNVLKQPVTWAGIFTTVFGAYLSYQVFGNEPSVRENIIREMQNNTPDPETIRQILLGLKVIATSVVTIGVSETIMGILEASNEQEEVRK